MSTPRKIIIGLLLALLSSCLFALPVAYGFKETVGNPEKVNKALLESNIYDSMVPGFIALANQPKSDAIPSTNEFLLNPEVQNAIKTAFTPDFMQQSTETILMSTYSWLQGDQSSIRFSIDIAEQKQLLAEKLTIIVSDKLSLLPMCTTSDVVPQNIFDLQCNPPAGTLNVPLAVRETLNRYIPEDTITESAFTQSKINSQGSTTEQQMAPLSLKVVNLPSLYQLLLLLPVLLLLVSIVLLLGVLVAHPVRSLSLKLLAITFLASGILLGLSGAVTLWLLIGGVTLPENDLGASAQSLVSAILTVIVYFCTEVSVILIWFAGSYVAISALLWAVWYKLKPQRLDDRPAMSIVTPQSN